MKPPDVVYPETGSQEKRMGGMQVLCRNMNASGTEIHCCEIFPCSSHFLAWKIPSPKPSGTPPAADWRRSPTGISGCLTAARRGRPVQEPTPTAPGSTGSLRRPGEAVKNCGKDVLYMHSTLVLVRFFKKSGWKPIPGTGLPVTIKVASLVSGRPGTHCETVQAYSRRSTLTTTASGRDRVDSSPT